MRRCCGEFSVHAMHMETPMSGMEISILELSNASCLWKRMDIQLKIETRQRPCLRVVEDGEERISDIYRSLESRVCLLAGTLYQVHRWQQCTLLTRDGPLTLLQ